MVTSLLSARPTAGDVVSLAGAWRFELDPKDTGEKEDLFTRYLADTIPLPGTTDQAKKGNEAASAQAVESIHPHPNNQRGQIPLCLRQGLEGGLIGIPWRPRWERFI